MDSKVKFFRDVFMIMYDACQTFCYIGMAGCFVGLCWNGFLMSFLTACAVEGNVYDLSNSDWMKDTCDKIAVATCPKELFGPENPDIIIRNDTVGGDCPVKT